MKISRIICLVLIPLAALILMSLVAAHFSQWNYVWGAAIGFFNGLLMWGLSRLRDKDLNNLADLAVITTIVAD